MPTIPPMDDEHDVDMTQGQGEQQVESDGEGDGSDVEIELVDGQCPGCDQEFGAQDEDIGWVMCSKATTR